MKKTFWVLPSAGGCREREDFEMVMTYLMKEAVPGAMGERRMPQTSPSQVWCRWSLEETFHGVWGFVGSLFTMRIKQNFYFFIVE